MVGQRGGGCERPLFLLAVVLALAAATLSSGCGTESPGPTAVASRAPSATAAPQPFPATPAGEQLAWVVGRMNAGASLGEAEIQSRFSPQFLAQVPADELAIALAQVAVAGPLRFGATLESSGPATLIARLDRTDGVSLRATIVVEPSGAGRITGLLFQPYTSAPQPTNWDEVDERLAELAGQASLLAIEVGREAPVHAREAERVGAIGSAFKLYVLGALAAAVAEGSASWDERLAIHDAWKSLPSGDLRNEPAGRRFTLRRYAEEMIAVSDNTAADHLIHRLGRSDVEAGLETMGMTFVRPDLPFLTTREMFALKLSAPDALRSAYVAAAPQARRVLLTARRPSSRDARQVVRMDHSTRYRLSGVVRLAGGSRARHGLPGRRGAAPRADADPLHPGAQPRHHSRRGDLALRGVQGRFGAGRP